MPIANSTNSVNLFVVNFRLNSGGGFGNVTNGTSIFMLPYNGNIITLYDGNEWAYYESAAISIAIPAVADKMYDVFCYLSSGVPTLEVLAWTNDSTRATAITLLNGAYVKSGDSTRLYLGSFRTKTSGTCNNNAQYRNVWNMYNRVTLLLQKAFVNTTWTYATAAVRQVDAQVENCLGMVVGVNSSQVVTDVMVIDRPTDTVAISYVNGIGDNTTASLGNGVVARSDPRNGTYPALFTRWYTGLTAGYHVLSANESQSTTGTSSLSTTFYVVGLMAGLHTY